MHLPCVVTRTAVLVFLFVCLEFQWSLKLLFSSCVARNCTTSVLLTLKMDKLDPNFVIVSDDNDKLTHLIKALKQFDLKSIITPGNDSSSRFIFLRINNKQHVANLNKIVSKFNDEISDFFPLYDNKKTLQLNVFYKKINGCKFNFHQLKPFEIELLNQITNNANQSLFLAFFSDYNSFLKKLSITGCLTYLFTSNAKQFEFNNFFTIISIIMSLNFVTRWIYRDKKKWIRKLSYDNNQLLNINKYNDTNNKNKKFNELSTVLTIKFLETPIILAFVLTLIVVQLFCFSLEIFFTQFYNGSLKSILALVPTVIMAIFTPILTIFYNNFFVDKSIILENGKYSKISQNEKNFILSFFVNYMPLLITLFFYLPFGYLFPQNIHLLPFENFFVTDYLYFAVNTKRHQNQFFYFTFTNQLIGYATEYILPIILIYLQKKKLRKDNKTTKIEDTIKNEYDHCFNYWKKAENYSTYVKNTFDVDSNYKKLILQFGFITMFCSIWPLAPLLVYIINQIILKTTLWKAISNSRPTMIPNNILDHNKNANPTNNNDNLNMKPWENILKVMVIIGCVISSSITFMYNYCILPGIQDRKVLEEVNSWIKFIPFNENWYIIILYAIIMEHISILIFNLLKKYYLNLSEYSKEYHQNGIVPMFTPRIITDKTNNGKNQEECEFEPIFTKPTKAKDSKPQFEKINNNNQENVTLDHLKNEQKSTTINDTKISNDLGNIKKKTHVIETEGKSEDLNTDHLKKIDTVNISNVGKENTVYNGVNPSIDYYDNFTITQSDTAGASLPLLIPTSKNYDLRFDENFNAATNATSSSMSDVSNSMNSDENNVVNEKINNISINDLKRVDNKENEKSEIIKTEPVKSSNANSKSDVNDNDIKLKEKKLNANNPSPVSKNKPLSSRHKSMKSIKSHAVKSPKELHAHSPIKSSSSQTHPINTHGKPTNYNSQGHDSHSTKSKNSAKKSIKSTTNTGTTNTGKTKKKTIFGKIKF